MMLNPRIRLTQPVTSGPRQPREPLHRGLPLLALGQGEGPRVGLLVPWTQVREELGCTRPVPLPSSQSEKNENIGQEAKGGIALREIGYREKKHPLPQLCQQLLVRSGEMFVSVVSSFFLK